MADPFEAKNDDDVSKASLHPTTTIIYIQKKLRDSMTPKVSTPKVSTPVGLRLRIAGLQVASGDARRCWWRRKARASWS